MKMPFLNIDLTVDNDRDCRCYMLAGKDGNVTLSFGFPHADDMTFTYCKGEAKNLAFFLTEYLESSDQYDAWITQQEQTLLAEGII